MITSEHSDQELFEPVEGIALPVYVEVCRTLVRSAGDSVRRIDEVLAARGLSREAWNRIRTAWSERIRRDATVRAEFGRLYAAPQIGDAGTREG